MLAMKRALRICSRNAMTHTHVHNKTFTSVNANTNRDHMKNTKDILETMSSLKLYGIELKGLPNIAVVADQSEGKSSLIDALCNHDILPKSAGLGTKIPVDITIMRGPRKQFFVQDEEFFSEKDVRQRIDDLNRSNLPKIVVRIIDPDCHDICFTDTPGVFSVSEEDKSMDPRKIKDLIRSYTSNKNNIFVLVSSAGSDQANSQTYKLLMKENRLAETLGVITKTDLIATGKNDANIVRILNNELYKTGYGWAATVLRTDKAIAENKTIEEQIQTEKEFFSKRPNLVPSGIPKVREILSNILFEKIKHNISIIIPEIDKNISELESSSTFLERFMNNSEDKMAAELGVMINKLVESAQDRADFEYELRNRILAALIERMKTTYVGDEDKFEIVDMLSEKQMPSQLVSYHSSQLTDAKNFSKSNFKEMFSSGIISPIVINNETIQKAWNEESKLGCCIGLFDPKVNDALGRQHATWKRYIGRFFSVLHKDNTIEKMSYEITEKMLLDYINSGSNQTELSQQFSKYIVRDIGNRAFEKIAVCIRSLVHIEKRPDVDPYEITRELTQMYAPHLKFQGGLYDYFSKNKQMINLEIFGVAWNIAHLRTVIRKLGINIDRTICTTYLDELIPELVRFILGLNKETATKKKNEVGDKIKTLKKFKMILQNSEKFE